MKAKAKYVVTFKNSYDKLVNMFARSYDSAERAKTAIELDAEHFVWAHRFKDKSGAGIKYRQKHGWIKPKTEDYYEAQAQDGERCIWQYFKI